ncbi:MAG: tRNA pseudouridine(13) synthase TruD [Planctomycetota bacterium]
MRLKVTPADFRVREQLDFPADPAGEHWVHVLHKEKLSTQEALSQIVQHGAVDRAAIAYAGLKDRQAVTEQHLSIAGRAVELKLPGLNLRPIGRSPVPINSRMSRGNAFTITVRDLKPVEAAQLRRSLPSLQVAGFPNYFDDQRFGCLRHGQGFAMLQVLRGDFEAALQQLIAAPSPRAITGDVKLKQALQRLWGDWDACQDVARGPIYQPLFQHLQAHPRDFRGALELLPLRLRVIHSFAYQSFLWNRAVSLMLRGGVPSAQRLRISTLAGDLLAWKYLDPEREQKLVAMDTPLFAPDGQGGSPVFKKAMIAELDNADLRPSHFRENVVPGMVWREEPRAVFVKPRDLGEVRIEPDDMYQGRVKATLSFGLPRGAYATMLLKRLFAPSFYAADRDRPPQRDRGDHGERPGRGGYGGRPYRTPRGGSRDEAPPPSPRRSAPWETVEEDHEA